MRKSDQQHTKENVQQLNKLKNGFKSHRKHVKGKLQKYRDSNGMKNTELKKIYL